MESKGNWNGWKLGWADDNNFYITSIGKSRPWVQGRSRGKSSIVEVEVKGDVQEQLDGLKCLLDIQVELGGIIKKGNYSNVELKVKENELNKLFNY